MSHYRVLKMKVLSDVNPSLFAKALKKMDKGFSIKMEKGRGTLYKNDEKTTIHFDFVKTKENKMSCTISGEFFHTGYMPEVFAKELTKTYTEIKIEDVVKVQKMTPVKRTVKENGDIVLRFAVAG